ncbi:helix-turn-helix domain-containing protein [Cognatiyoonia sp. IB215182]|uniref:helix-turn-helix domain-containing protein n=1 Tax=Cognatiyoonia sp. IB215182 TaxID=3097353 RepID=UPI002A15775D|nr:helix-turn-helix domain-containing protein [Cognatiyoonia sp. IB215182]MDX8354335.1 helix-turn-helix domain-containing protein [Cognatiyoonia sp. IB215182]
MKDSVRPIAQVEPFVRVLGVDLAIEFLLTFGGAQLTISRNPRPHSRLVKLVGIDKTIALAEACEHLPSRIPTAKPWIAAVWKSRGVPIDEIARRLHTSDVTVRTMLKKQGAWKGQMPPHKPLKEDRQLRLL